MNDPSTDRPTPGRRSRTAVARMAGGLAVAGLVLAFGTAGAAQARPAPEPVVPQGPASPLAGPINGGFESGLANWFSSGNVEPVQDTNFTPLITPTQGGQMALLCNGPGNQGRVGASPANLDLDPGANDDNDRSILSQTFTLQPGTCRPR